jgi:hypothetical protein
MLLLPESAILGFLVVLRPLELGSGLYLLPAPLYGALIGCLWGSMRTWQGDVRHSKLESAIWATTGACLFAALYAYFGRSLFDVGDEWQLLHSYPWRAPEFQDQRNLQLGSFLWAFMALIAR